jgi:cytochrome c oxidase subunit 4
VSGHVVSRRIYLAVAAALMILLALTFGVSHLDLGRFNLVVTLVIAFIKMMLVVLFFMELRWSDRLTWIVAGAGFFWLLILIGLTLSDTLTRTVIAGP